MNTPGLPTRAVIQAARDFHQQTKAPQMTTSFPVLDDDTTDAMVLGFAASEAGAARIGRKHARVVGMKFKRLRPAFGVQVTYDPNINTRAQANRANARGRGWVVELTEG